jgi:hypothetical protein
VLKREIETIEWTDADLVDALGQLDRALRVVAPEPAPEWRDAVFIPREGGLALVKTVKNDEVSEPIVMPRREATP